MHVGGSAAGFSLSYSFNLHSCWHGFYIIPYWDYGSWAQISLGAFHSLIPVLMLLYLVSSFCPTEWNSVTILLWFCVGFVQKCCLHCIACPPDAPFRKVFWTLLFWIQLDGSYVKWKYHASHNSRKLIEVFLVNEHL